MLSEGLKNKAILVFGKTGQIGRALQAQNLPGWFFSGRDTADFTERNSVEQILTSRKWDVIINAAAYTNVDQAEAEEKLAHVINAETPAFIAEFCRTKAIPFIHLSTDYVFDGLKESAYDENDDPAPLNAYGRSKLAGEQNILQAGGNGLILRTAWVYGSQGRNFVRTMLKLAQTKDVVLAASDQIGSPTASQDFAEALWTLLPQVLKNLPEMQILHVAGTGEVSRYDLVRAIADTVQTLGFRTTQEIVAVPSSFFPSPAKRPARSSLDCSRLTRLYGITLPEWRHGLKDVIKTCVDSST